MAMDFKTAQTLVSAYSKVQNLNEAMTSLEKLSKSRLEIDFTVSFRTGNYNKTPLFDDKTFHDTARGEIRDFLVMKRRRQLSLARAEAIRTINQIGGIEPPPHPFAI